MHHGISMITSVVIRTMDCCSMGIGRTFKRLWDKHNKWETFVWKEYLHDLELKRFFLLNSSPGVEVCWSGDESKGWEIVCHKEKGNQLIGYERMLNAALSRGRLYAIENKFEVMYEYI